MCTLIVLHRCVPNRPLVVAANRDEFLERPAEGMAIRPSVNGPIVAPLDLEAGGTWVGLSGRGVFVGLTNLRPATQTGQATVATAASPVLEPNRELRSRGEVVMMALEAESAGKAIETLLALDVERFNPFQLLVADGREAWLLVYRGEARAVQLEPGPHVVGNVVDERIEAALSVASMNQSESLDAESRVRKLTRVRERVEKLMTESGRDLFEGLAGICREHVESDLTGLNELEGRNEREGSACSPFESTCVHVADRYGTRSSLLLELSADPDANRLWTTDGPPCERPYENRSSLLRELGVRQSSWTETETA
jgi:uncharacterized protein with NRDE domain